MIVHYVGWADQPYVRIKCTDTDHYVGPNQGGLPPEVHRCDGPAKTELFYTFNERMTNCFKCLGCLDVEAGGYGNS